MLESLDVTTVVVGRLCILLVPGMGDTLVFCRRKKREFVGPFAVWEGASERCGLLRVMVENVGRELFSSTEM